MPQLSQNRSIKWCDGNFVIIANFFAPVHFKLEVKYGFMLRLIKPGAQKPYRLQFFRPKAIMSQGEWNLASGGC